MTASLTTLRCSVQIGNEGFPKHVLDGELALLDGIVMRAKIAELIIRLGSDADDIDTDALDVAVGVPLEGDFITPEIIRTHMEKCVLWYEANKGPLL